MLVYGDAAREQDPRDLIEDIGARLAGWPALSSRVERHAGLIGAFVQASELAQALADASFAAQGLDAGSPEGDAAMALLMTLAKRVIASWDAVAAEAGASGGSVNPSGEVPSPDAAPVLARLEALGRLNLPDRVTTRTGEGYAFYALYPEAYAMAAKAWTGQGATRVIGLRSIGAGLSAMVAAALGAPAPTTVRPLGPAFQRRLRLSPGLHAELLSDPEARFALVDEGPGLSGSSLGCVADMLEDAGVASQRITFFPSHAGGLGPMSNARHRLRWETAQRPVVSFDDLVSPDRLATWVEDLTGPSRAPVEDISGGAWRERLQGPETWWPPANTVQERRKFLITTASGPWLLKFVGLGPSGEQAFARARLLASAGFTPTVAGLRHGFLVQRWAATHGLVDPSERAPTALVDHIGRYLAFRACHLPADTGAGAGLAALLEMMQVNTAEALGAAQAARFEPWRARLPALQRRLRRVETDNRMHPWEWMRDRNGALLKADAVDHGHAHDLIGCQDIAWDVAGAAVEFNLDTVAMETLRQRVSSGAGFTVSPALAAFYTPAYLAFQLGYYAMAAESHAHWPQEQARLRGRRDRYGDRLKTLLAASVWA